MRGWMDGYRHIVHIGLRESAWISNMLIRLILRANTQQAVNRSPNNNKKRGDLPRIIQLGHCHFPILCLQISSSPFIVQLYSPNIHFFSSNLSFLIEITSFYLPDKCMHHFTSNISKCPHRESASTPQGHIPSFYNEKMQILTFIKKIRHQARSTMLHCQAPILTKFE